MCGYIIDAMRFLAESIFGYLLLNRAVGRTKLHKLIMFSAAYVTIVSAYNLEFQNNASYRLICALIFGVYFCAEAREFKNWKFFVVYSFFVNIILELVHFLSFKLVMLGAKYGEKIFGGEGASSDVLMWGIIFAVYVMMLATIYYSGLIKTSNIRTVSKFLFSPLIFGIALIALVIIKYYMKLFYKNSYSEGFCLILSNLLIMAICAFFFIIVAINRWIANKNRYKNDDDEAKIIRALSENDSRVPFDIASEKYNDLKQKIIAKLNRCGMYDSRQGFYDIVFSVIIIKCYIKNERAVLSKNVYPIISKITGDNVKLIDTNIRNLIKDGWLNADPAILEKEYTKPLDGEKGYPTAKDFLMYISATID